MFPRPTDLKRDKSKHFGEKSVIRRGPNPLPKSVARKAAKMIADGMPISRTMTALGYAASTASDHPEKLTQSPAYLSAKEELKNSVIKAGVNFDLLAKKVKRGLEASKTVRIYETGETESVPDHDAQIKYWDRAARALGIEDEKNTGQVNINIVGLIRQARAERQLETE